MDKIKPLSIRLPRELWVFLKKRAVEKETSMNEMIISQMEKLRNKCEKNVDWR